MDDTTLRQFLNQMCLDGQMDDEEIDEFLDVMMDKVIPEIREPLEQQINELKGYVQHTKKCQQYYQSMKLVKCTCGLDKLLNKH